MPTFYSIQPYGDQLKINYQDGTNELAYPTANGNTWLVKPGSGGGGGSPAAWVRPIAARFHIVSGFGPRPSPGGIGSTNHQGVDFSGSGVTDEQILAAADGKVVAIGTEPTPGVGFGYSVALLHADGSRTMYGHQIRLPPVTMGQMFAAGDVIGNVGSTGASTGAHLHFETRNKAAGAPVDPIPFMLARGVTITP